MIVQIIFLSLFQLSVGRKVFITCEQNCKVDNDQINGGDGKNIVLKYTINTKESFILTLAYETEEFITFIPMWNKSVIDHPPPFIDTSKSKVATLDNGYEFSFAVKSLERNMQNKRFISHLTNSYGKRETDTWSINVY